MALNFIIMTASTEEPHNPPALPDTIGAIRLWLDGVASDRWIMVTESWDGITGQNIKLADLGKFRVKVEEILTQAKVALADFSPAKRKKFRMDLKIPGAWLNGYPR